MALPAGVPQLGTFKGAKGDTGVLAELGVELLPWNSEPFAEMTGPDAYRGAVLHIPMPLPSPETVTNDLATEALLLSDTASRAAMRSQTIGKGELIVNVVDYGAVGDGVADDTAAIQAAIDAAFAMTGIDFGGTFGATRGATVYFPPGVFITTTPLKYKSGVSLKGAGMYTSRLFNNSTDLFAWGANEIVFDSRTSDIWFSTGASGGHIFNLTGLLSAGIARSTFSRVKMNTIAATSSIWKQRESAQLIDVEWNRCIFDTLTTRTVPAFDISVLGRDSNSVRWISSWCHSHQATAAPFFRVESQQSWNYNLTFKDLVGEQNGGGFIHVYAVDGLVIENCPDWDHHDAYLGDVIRVSPVGSRTPKNVRIQNSYRIGNVGGLGAGVYDLYLPSGLNKNVRVAGPSPSEYPEIKAVLGGDATIDGRTKGFTILTASTTLNMSHGDDIVCNSATAISVTLPAAIGCVFGQRYRIKNIGSGVVTIVGTVDGAASPTLAQWAKTEVRTDGANANFGRIWFTV